MKKYRVKQGEDLGSIARTFGLASWKYLYTINEEAVGDNPDLLAAGTELEIPLWDSTSGEEKIAEKGADPFAYTGGVRYRYPWVPFSVTLMDGDEETYEAVVAPEQYDDAEAYDEESDQDDDEKRTESAEGSEDSSDADRMLDLSDGVEAEIVMTATGETIFSGKITGAAELSMLLPDTPNFRIGIEGVPLLVGQQLHMYGRESDEESQ